MAAVEINLACDRGDGAVDPSEDAPEPAHLVTPGDLITTDTGFMRGHGTYLEGDRLQSSVAGVVERVNKLIRVEPLKTRYNGEVGDVVVGRVTELAQKRWKIETHARLDSILHLNSVNLPGGELRRRSDEDERAMREYLAEGDLISAEVQQVHSDGALALHTRSLKYGKLGQGVLVKVSPSLVKRRKSHFHSLPCGCSIILGNNGYVWIYPTTTEEESKTGGFYQNLRPVDSKDRETIARLRNCILAIAEHKMMLYDTTVLYAFEASAGYDPGELLKPKVKAEIFRDTLQRLELEGFGN